jgi:hypothetical protein
MKYFLFIVLSLLLLTSCLPPHYIHAPLITADLEKKGDYTISGSLAASSETINFNFNANYAITDHWILQTSITHRDDYLNGNTYDSKGNSVDAAVGYNTISSNKNFYVESFMGYGSGTFKNTSIEEVNSFANFGYNKFFSQVNFNYRINNSDEDTNTFSFHFPIRLEYVYFNEINYNGEGTGIEKNQIEYLKDNPNKWILSLGKTISYRFDNLKLNLFASYHSPTKADEFVSLGNVYIGFGISWRNFLNKKNK